MAAARVRTFAVLKTNARTSEIVSWIALVAAVLISCASCADSDRGVDQSRVEGLIAIHCGSCHLVPRPEELTRDRWEDYVLPRMGYFLGIYESPQQRIELIEQNAGGKIVEAAKVFPDKPIIGEEDWQDDRRALFEQCTF